MSSQGSEESLEDSVEEAQESQALLPTSSFVRWSGPVRLADNQMFRWYGPVRVAQKRDPRAS